MCSFKSPQATEEKAAPMNKIKTVWDLPQPPIHGRCSSWDNLGDENPRIIGNMGIVNTSCDAETQARVPLRTIDNFRAEFQ